MRTAAKWGLVWLAMAVAFTWFNVFQINHKGHLIFWPETEDSLFIETDQGQQILVNGGEGRKILRNLSQAMPWGDKSLDLVVLTSSTDDHVAGLIEVLENYQVGRVLWNGVAGQTPLSSKWEDLLKTKKIPIIIARAGEKIELGSSVLEILAPSNNLNRYQLNNLTKGDLVWRLKGKDKSILFLGSISRLELSSLAKEELRADIVEVNEVQEFLPWLFWSEVNPSLVVVSGSFQKTNSLFGIALRQTEKEGKIIINF